VQKIPLLNSSKSLSLWYNFTPRIDEMLLQKFKLSYGVVFKIRFSLIETQAFVETEWTLNKFANN
jgi:hypothetical protein